MGLMSIGFIAPSILPPLLLNDLNMRVLETLAARVSVLDLEPVLLYDFDHAPASALIHLAEQFNLLGDAGWDLADTEPMKRALLKEAIALHRFKGTPWSMKRVLALLGFGTAVLEEGWVNVARYNGAATFDGVALYGDGARHWAEYDVVFDVPVQIAQAKKLAAVLSRYAPARCHLRKMVSNGLRYNAVAAYDGAYSFGNLTYE
jgi:phage tail P2-like protein